MSKWERRDIEEVMQYGDLCAGIIRFWKKGERGDAMTFEGNRILTDSISI